MFEFSNALRVGEIANLPPWDVEKLVKVMDINSDGNINLPELDIALMNIRNTLGIEFIPFEESTEEDAESETEEPVEETVDSEEQDESDESEEENEDNMEEKTSAPTEAELKKMKKAELVDVAKSMGLSHSGTKSDLIERITQA
jgi:hypothetical protein